MRPRATRWTESADEAVVAAWRVTGFVTEVATRSVSVAVAASARQTYGSPERFCESTTFMPSQPRFSASRANSALRVGAATVAVQNSMAALSSFGSDPVQAHRTLSVRVADP